MERKKKSLRTVFYMISAALLVVVLIGVLAALDRRNQDRGGITLPPADAAVSQGQPETPAGESFVEVTPENAPAVAASLHRPGSYHQTLQIEYFSDGVNSSRTTVEFWASGEVTRITSREAGGTRNILTDGKTAHVWYADDAWNVETVELTEDMTADALAGFPTYETVISMPTDQIRTAEYTVLSGDTAIPCLLVKAATAEHITTGCWIDLSTGLLRRAEGTYGDEPVYTVQQTALELPEQGNEAFGAMFRLPNGKTPFPIAGT